MRPFRAVPLLAVLAFLLAVSQASAIGPYPLQCSVPRSRADELVNLGNGSYHFVGSIFKNDWTLTLKDFRRRHPNRAITDITVGAWIPTYCLEGTQLAQITFRTVAVKSPKPKRPAR